MDLATDLMKEINSIVREDTVMDVELVIQITVITSIILNIDTIQINTKCIITITPNSATKIIN